MSAQPSNCVTSLSAALDHLHSAKLILKSEATSKITSDNSVTPHNARFPHRDIILPEKKEIRWVECSHCLLWFHLWCVEEIDYSGNFICAVCKRLLAIFITIQSLFNVGHEAARNT